MLLRHLAILLFPFALAACNSHEHKPVEKDYTLGPRARNTITIKAKSKTRVYFVNKLDSEQRKQCENQCSRMYYIDRKGQGEAVTSPLSGNLDIEPEKGEIEVVIENLEKFPMQLKVGHKPLDH